MIKNIKEGPDQVIDQNGNEITHSRMLGTIAFIIYETKKSRKLRYAYVDRSNEELSAFHDGVSKKIIGDYVSLVSSRIWPREHITSTYQDEKLVMKYKDTIEKMFKELNLNINDYEWDYGDSSEKEGLKKWITSSFSSNIEVDEETLEKMNNLFKQLHTATPIDKIRVKKEIEGLQLKLHIPSSEIDAALKSSMEKWGSIEKDKGSIAASNFYRGSIAEEKIRIYNKTLDPNLWDENKNLRDGIGEYLIKIATDFYKSTDFKSEILKILMLGSSVNYNWTPQSDIDLHVVIDISAEKINEDYARKFMDSLGSKWNSEHNIEVKGHKVEVYLQDIREKNGTIDNARPDSAMFSLSENKWLISPKPEHISLDKEKITQKYIKIKNQIEYIIKTEDLEKLKNLMTSIRNYRNSGLDKSGEFSTENIVFKALRHTGLLTKLKDSINSIYDRKVSINENFILNELVKNMVIYGNIDRYLEVNNVSYDNGIHHGKGKRWRHKVGYPFIFWWEKPTEEDKRSVENYLDEVFNIKGIRYHKRLMNYGDSTISKLHQHGEDLWENKHDPFKSKDLQFVTYGGLSLTKQKGYKADKSVDMTFHEPPARKGIYAFVWPYIEKFLLGGDEYVDPKRRGKGQRQRIQYIKDKEGNVITSDHPDYEKYSAKDKIWSLTREKPNQPNDDEDRPWTDFQQSILYRNSARKKFTYNGDIWHHLSDHVLDHLIIDKKGSWVKTDMPTFKDAFKKELKEMLKSAKSSNDQRGLKHYGWDHLEVFIDQKI